MLNQKNYAKCKLVSEENQNLVGQKSITDLNSEPTQKLEP